MARTFKDRVSYYEKLKKLHRGCNVRGGSCKWCRENLRIQSARVKSKAETED